MTIINHMNQWIKGGLFLIIFALSPLFGASPVLAVSCQTGMLNGRYCDPAGGRSWCHLISEPKCAVEITCSPVANGSNVVNCNTNTCSLTCNSGYTKCSGTCLSNTPPGGSNCATYNPCNSSCTVCNAGYELSGGACVAATLKLGSSSVSGTNVIQAASGALLYVNGTRVGVNTNNPSSTLHVVGVATLSDDLAMTAGKSIKLDGASDTILYVGNYSSSGGFSFGTSTSPMASIYIEGDLRANRLCFQNDCKAGWSEIQGTNYWTVSGNDIYSNNSGNVGIGTATPGAKLHVAGTIRTSLSGTGNRCLYVTSDGDIAAKSVDCGTATGGDNLGDHIATQNLRLGSYWLSGDGGNEGISVDSSGKVGIGTTNPGAKLEVVGNNNYAPLKISRASNDKQIGVSYYPAGALSNSNKAWIMGLEENSNDFSFYNWNGSTVNNLLYLTNTNNVGIGTTSPAYKLAVAGTGYFNSPVIVGTPIDVGHAATKAYVDDKMVSWTKLDTFPAACQAGQVVTGIGSTLTCTTTAGTTYTAGNGLNLSGNTFSLAASGTSNYLTKWTGTNTLGQGIIYDNGTNVGIGTTTPQAKLDVSGIIKTNSAVISTGAPTWPTTIGPYTAMYYYTSGDAGRLFAYNGSAYKDLAIGDWSGGNPNIMLKVGGKVGIGTGSPANQLSVVGSADFSGSVGIGTTSPAYKLSVVGTAYFSSPVIVGPPTAINHAATKSYVDTTIAAIATHTPLTLANIGSTPNAQGASLSDQALTLQPASASYGGVVTTGTQAFAGAKTFNSTINGDISGSAVKLAANGDNCAPGYYPLGVDEKGKAEDCTLITGGGTYTADGNGLELVGNSFRLELNGTTLSTSSAGLRVNAIGSTEISDGSIVNADISGLAAISASKIENGTYFINSAGTNGYVWTSDGSGAGTWSAASTIPANNITGSTAGTLNYIPKYTANYTLANSLIYDNGTNVGIGTSSPGTKLTVAGAVSFDNNKILSNGSGNFFASNFYDQDNTSYYLDPAAATSINAAGIIKTENNFFTQNGQYLAQNSSTTNPTFSWVTDTNTGLFRKAADTVAFTTNGSEKFSLNGSGKAIFTNGSVNLMTIEYSAGLSGALVTIGDGGTSKLDVGTVDPIYTIGGQKYATYMAGMTGVKEETSGVLVLNKQSAGLFMAKLDFQKAPEGSDIWLFGRTANLINSQDNFDQLACLLTPNFAGQAWYEKDVSGRIINIFARPENSNRVSVEMSYRLTAPRFDYQQWTNYSSSEHEGFNLDKLLQ